MTTAHELASQLLAGPDLPIQILAEAVGWANIGSATVSHKHTKPTHTGDQPVVIIVEGLGCDDKEDEDSVDD